MNIKDVTRVHYLQIATLASILFAIVGFSYNVWRAEETEKNNNLREACFEITRELGNFEQIVYAARYDGDLVNAGSPRSGWVRIGLITELSLLTTEDITEKANNLKMLWSTHWESFHESQKKTDLLTNGIDDLRRSIRIELLSLK